MPNILDSLCKFKIGDNVTVKTQALIASGHMRPQIMQILDRVVIECYGGMQINYSCRISGVPGDGEASTVKDPFTFTEPELVEWTPPTPKS